MIFRPKVDRKGSCTRERFCSNIFGRVMCPTDFSKPSVEVLSLVRSMTYIDEIALVHVVDDKMHQEDIGSDRGRQHPCSRSIQKTWKKQALKYTVHVLKGFSA